MIKVPVTKMEQKQARYRKLRWNRIQYGRKTACSLKNSSLQRIRRDYMSRSILVNLDKELIKNEQFLEQIKAQAQKNVRPEGGLLTGFATTKSEYDLLSNQSKESPSKQSQAMDRQSDA